MRRSFEEKVLFLKSNPYKKVKRNNEPKDCRGFYFVLGEIPRFDYGFEIDYSVKECC